MVLPEVAMVLLIVEVPAENVRLVEVVNVKGVTPVRVIVLAPKLIALTLELLDVNPPAVTAYPAVLNVPFVTVSVDPVFNASAS